MYKAISAYGVVGNLCTVALVGLDGSIDWLCLPYIDSPSVFAALLDDEKGGSFSVRPTGPWDSVARYIPRSNVLRTQFRTPTGVLTLTDFMPVLEAPGGHCELYRHIQVQGHVEVQMRFAPRFDYARLRPRLQRTSGQQVLAKSSEGHTLWLTATKAVELGPQEAFASWGLGQAEQVWLRLSHCEAPPPALQPRAAQQSLQETIRFWQDWLQLSETGLKVQLGPYEDMLNRSALLLKLLQFAPTGTIAASATTSLPEQIGGSRNWDYRYSWLRDTAFTLRALFELGHMSEMEQYMGWLRGLLLSTGAEGLRIMYGLRGEEELAEVELGHLRGYKDSRPVRVGNDAYRQRQLDVYGELLDAALRLSDYVGKVDASLWPALRGLCEHVRAHWREPDHGIWEMRGPARHFVHSKLMCWVALDRGIAIARRYGFQAPLQAWQAEKERIKEEILARGYSESLGAFKQSFEAEVLDASTLLIPTVGLLPYRNPRVLNTVQRLQKELGQDGLLWRYRAPDGLEGSEGAFLLCSFWLLDNLVGQGRLDEAEHLLYRLQGLSNHLGLFAEQYDPQWQEPLGNFPQAFTHIGYINSVLALCKAQGKHLTKERSKPMAVGLSFSRTIVLNEGEPPEELLALGPQELSQRLKAAVNTLRGAFFDTERGRVAYEQMRGTEPYEQYVALTRALRAMDLRALKDRAEQLAFWINLYNAIVIHGVVELGIRDSVKEVKGFFRRIQYRIADMLFCPDDIEHGILRDNRRPPGLLRRPLFGTADKRRQFVVRPLEPRVHFALVCASSSCPPIAFYTAEGISQELDLAATTFINGGGCILQKEKGRVSLSMIFKWYRQDFGSSKADVLRFIAKYLYEHEDRDWLLGNAQRVKVSYQPYDWRLNKY
jgi:GH15 family glucan-1,4-alpha-glucosidase